MLLKEADLSLLNGLRIKATTASFFQLKNIQDLKEVVSEANDKKLEIFPIGLGTNIVWGTKNIDKAVIQIALSGYEVVEKKDYSLIKIGSGENWDKCVEKSVKNDLSGIEALSSIPGNAGTTPVQNVGAYGSEISNALEEVQIFDLVTGEFKNLSNRDCKFGYRDSVFKKNLKGKAIITSITLRLSKKPPSIPRYVDVETYFTKMKIKTPDLAQIRQAIQEIRASKLPDPKLIPNCGSFFKNPIVTKDEANKIKTVFPNMPYYENVNGVKISAGWLIDTIGLKGKRFGTIEIYNKNALVLVATEKKAKIEDLIAAKNYIIKKIREDFGITLETEPDIIY